MPDRQVRFPELVWQTEDLPQQTAVAVQRVMFQLLDNLVPVLVDPFPADAPLPGAYELHLPVDGGTMAGPSGTP